MTTRQPARFSPWMKGVYEVTPNLRPLGADFGNGDLDRKVFLVDDESGRYHANKRSARKRRPSHVGGHRLEPEVLAAAEQFISARLAADWPDLFEPSGGGLYCRLTGNTARGVDEMMMEVQEDLAIVSTSGGEDWVSYVHVCSPGHWNPVSKLGASFQTGHEVVPGMEQVIRAASGLVGAMVNRGPWIRFVWGLETDDRLDHHPEPPPDANPEEWDGRQFDRKPLTVRVERQVLCGLPDVGAALFFIRVFTIPGNEILADPESRCAMRSAVLTMTPAQRSYKGIERHFDALLAQLATPE